jgi:hypothetical protein
VDEGAARRGIVATQWWRDREWVVRAIPGGGSEKTYRCPGCDHEIPPGVAHVVSWPVEGSLGDRRHWHTPCWRARDRRFPQGRLGG